VYALEYLSLTCLDLYVHTSAFAGEEVIGSNPNTMIATIAFFIDMPFRFHSLYQLPLTINARLPQFVPARNSNQGY
jgi:hypothetical protein